MPLATSARALPARLRPWLGKAVHVRWTLHRSFYQKEADALLLALSRYQGRLPPSSPAPGGPPRAPPPRVVPADLAQEPDVRGGGPGLPLVARHRRALVRAAPTPRKPAARATRSKEPLAKQPEKLLRMLGCRRRDANEVPGGWRRFLKANHPDLNPGQSDRGAPSLRRGGRALAALETRGGLHGRRR